MRREYLWKNKNTNYLTEQGRNKIAERIPVYSPYLEDHMLELQLPMGGVHVLEHGTKATENGVQDLTRFTGSTPYAHPEQVTVLPLALEAADANEYKRRHEMKEVDKHA
jgi:hypothetical protein